MRPLTTIFILLFSVSALAQADVLSQRVSFNYRNERLKPVLTDLSKRYRIHFSYSSDYVNVRQRVSVRVHDVPLSIGLDKLFAETQIVYSLISNHIVLKTDEDKLLTPPDSGSQSIEIKEISEPEDEIPTLLVSEELPPEAPARDTLFANPIKVPDMQTVRSEGKMYPFDETLLNLEKWRRQAEWATKPRGGKRIAQVSVFPFIGTNTYKSDEVTNNLSMNVLWGVSAGVDGMELGGFVNTVRKDVNGLQAAGIGNTAGRNVTGTQFGGLFNYAGGAARGLQAAGLVNFAGRAEAAQAAGLMNWVKGDVAGLQASGLFNRTGGNAAAFQAAGAFNFNRGDAKVQVSGMFNVARDVEIGQFGGLLNVAREVKGFQIALINVSDTVSGVPIGLINIVKRGYNKFEIYGGEGLHGNLQLKLGANAFYNIFYVGARYPQGGGTYTWGLGYGIGTVSILSPKSSFNFELMAIHISENEPWTNTLNSVGQFRFLWNHQLGKSIGFFLGPTANVMVSQLRNAETGKVGQSPIVPYALIDNEINANTTLKGWVGVNAGFRF
ncbi:MAG: secretin and TonB N-terminal domain-containing protein [Saprospiraceae bacterium]